MSAGNAAAGNAGTGNAGTGDAGTGGHAHRVAENAGPAKPRLAAGGPARHSAGMDRDAVNELCATFPGADRSDPWGGGHDAWKIGGKMFACIGMDGRGVSVKTADLETAAMLIEVGVAERAPYFHRSWVLLPFATTEADEMAHRLAVSYDLIRAKLPRKVQAALAPRDA